MIDVETSPPDSAAATATAEKLSPNAKPATRAISPGGCIPTVVPRCSSIPVETGFRIFTTHKGGVTLAFSALVYVCAWAALRYTPWHATSEMVVAIAEAALIGGLCDYIALKTSSDAGGIWLGSRAVAQPSKAHHRNFRDHERMADAMMIGDKLNRMNLVGRLGTALEEVDLADFLAAPAIERLLNRAAMYFEAPEVVDRLETFLRKALPNSYRRIYAALNRFGVKSISSQVASNLRTRLPQLRNDPELMATLEGAVHEIGQQLLN